MEYLYASIAGLFLAATIIVLQPGPPAPPQAEPPAPAPAAGEQWTLDLLAALGNTQPSQEAINFLAAWHRAEGGTAAYNWLNTTQDAPGATDYNSVHVRNYPDYQTGIQATAETLTNGRYPNTLAGLISNQPIVDDGELGTWGTGGGAVRAQLAQASQTPPDGATAPIRQQLVNYALSLQGIPYVRGGRSADGGDCSGTMEHIYLTVAGIDIGDTTFSQYPALQPIGFDQVEPGDLWYGQYADDQHTGMVADVDGDGRWDLINNGGLANELHVDSDFLSIDYFASHTMGFRRAL